MRRRLAIVISVGAVAAVAAGVPGSAGAEGGCPAGMILVPESFAPGNKDGMHPKDGSRDPVGGPGDGWVCAKVDPETGRILGGPDNSEVVDN